ncbi:hypothetical protein MAIT1_04275 [Magnetofaba australis IT-1]|uniref:Caspase family p20 domain-containing protein n=1 Tax=Magnetofaba australis IT-1 TaxID=1434232 RepID=A0A1Y2K5T3_9PROT|nr:hypothetical protein MAIT1_04275 [Magnetofaba australis IT-1]
MLLLALTSNSAQAAADRGLKLDKATDPARRVALVIGNSAYQHAGALRNPEHDARAVASKLRALGFDVVDGLDLDRRHMERAIRDFARKLRGAGVGLFYYAGHGLQVQGRNYLVPVDAALQDVEDLPFEAIPMRLIMTQLEREQRTNLVFLDACRNNPLARNLARSMGLSRDAAGSGGLAREQAGLGTLIAYATQPGNVAADGESRNSPFTQALLRHIDEPGLEVRQLMTAVRRDVAQTTHNRQIPWDHSSLMSDFWFVPKTREKSGPELAAALLPACDLMLSRNALTMPPTAKDQPPQNAYDCYQQALTLDFANTEARKGIAHIEQRIAEQCDTALRRNQPDRARIHLDKLRQINPESAAADELEARLNDLIALMERDKQERQDAIDRKIAQAQKEQERLRQEQERLRAEQEESSRRAREAELARQKLRDEQLRQDEQRYQELKQKMASIPEPTRAPPSAPAAPSPSAPEPEDPEKGRPLQEAELRAVLSGNTMSGDNIMKGKQLSIFFAQGGAVYGAPTKRGMSAISMGFGSKKIGDTGKWWVAGNVFCTKFERWHGGRKACRLMYEKDGEYHTYTTARSARGAGVLIEKFRQEKGDSRGLAR